MSLNRHGRIFLIIISSLYRLIREPHQTINRINNNNILKLLLKLYIIEISFIPNTLKLGPYGPLTIGRQEPLKLGLYSPLIVGRQAQGQI